MPGSTATDDGSDLFDRAVSLAEEGRLDECLLLFRRLVETEPKAVVASVSANAARMSVVASNLKHFDPRTWSCILLTHESAEAMPDSTLAELARSASECRAAYRALRSPVPARLQ